MDCVPARLNGHASTLHIEPTLILLFIFHKDTVISCGQIQDRTGRQFPILCDYDCQNILLNSTPLYLADRNREWQETGITFGRLLFTHESAQEIASLLDAYTKGAPHPEEYTRGLYYRGVL